MDASSDTRPSAKDTAELEAGLAARFRHGLCGFARRWLNDPVEAQDVAQETLRRVVIAVRAGRIADPEVLPAFVYETARHLCLVQRRAMQRRTRALDRLSRSAAPELAAGALQAHLLRERRTLVGLALSLLPEPDRELLLLIHYEELSIEQAAEQLGVTCGALRVRKHRALRRLRGLVLSERFLRAVKVPHVVGRGAQ